MTTPVKSPSTQFEWCSLPHALTRPHRVWSVLASIPDTESDVEVLVEDSTGSGIDKPWKVILFNDAVHTFEDVINQLIKATSCTAQHAEHVAWTVHTKGKALAYQGTFEQCFRVQEILRQIDLVTEIEG